MLTFLALPQFGTSPHFFEKNVGHQADVLAKRTVQGLELEGDCSNLCLPASQANSHTMRCDGSKQLNILIS